MAKFTLTPIEGLQEATVPISKSADTKKQTTLTKEPPTKQEPTMQKDPKVGRKVNFTLEPINTADGKPQTNPLTNKPVLQPRRNFPKGLKGEVDFREQKTRHNISQRVDLAEFSKELGERAMRKISSADDPLDVGSAVLTGSLIPLMTVGAVGQRSEAAIANPLLTAQQGELEGDVSQRLKQLYRASAEGVKGETLAEFGDVFYGSGVVPEPVAAALGLGTDLLLNPFDRLTEFTGAKTTKLIGQRAKNFMKKTGKTAFELSQAAQNQPKALGKYALDTKFRFMTDDFIDEGAPHRMAVKLWDTGKKRLYEPASEAQTRAMKTLKDQPLRDPDELAAKLDTVLEDFTRRGDADYKAIKDLADDLRTRNVQVDSPLVNELGVNFVNESVEKTSVKANQLVNTMDMIKNRADNNPIMIKAGEVINDHLKNQFPIFKKASEKWKAWRVYEESLENIVGRPKFVGRGATREALFPNASTLDNFWKTTARQANDKNVFGKRNLLEISRQLMSEGDMSAKEVTPLMKDVLDTAAASFFKKGKVSFLTGSVVGGVTGSLTGSRALGGFAGGAAALSSSPRLVGSAGRGASVAANRLRALGGSPAAQGAGRLGNLGAGRIITGREMEDEGFNPRIDVMRRIRESQQ